MKNALAHHLPQLAALFIALVFTAPVEAAREVIDFDADWRFALGEQEGAENPAFDDSSWRRLDVPHDWAFEADYAEDAAQEDRGGYKPGGVGWYRKSFDLPAGWGDKRVGVHFDGVYMNSEVWINGRLLGKRPYGYIPFHYDLTGQLRPGKNTIAVRVDNSLEPSARWYHGCGIYAHVRMIATEPVHVAKDGVFIRTPDISAQQASVELDVELKSTLNRDLKAKVVVTILDPNDKEVARAENALSLPPAATRISHLETRIPHPLLWDCETPHLYKAVSRVFLGGKTVDEVSTRFGVREVRWATDTGFWLNGKNIKLLGVADHLEAGPVGAAIPDELIRWKIQLLKDMGCNAIRVAHNPQVRVFYDLCDEMGMLVMDEIFDGWKRKAAQDYGMQAFDAWWERDLRTWLKANRNHPSVFVWSLGNETHGDIAPKLVRVCHEMDPTRRVTSGSSNSNDMDILGVNGGSENVKFFNQMEAQPPGKPFVSTEAPHTWQVRGYYRTETWYRDGYPNAKKAPFPCPNLTEREIFTYDWIHPAERGNRKQIFNSSYDNAMVRITARKNWEKMRDLPWHSGHFRWTGFDYLGEAGYVHGGWPFRAFMGGPLDLAGFKKDLYFFYQSQWTEEPMVHILPHWTHPKMKPGTKVPVWVYSNCDEVELFFNGQSLGKDRPGTRWDEMQCDWMVPWAPGQLEAVGYRGGREAARAVQATAGAPSRLKLSVEGIRFPIVTVQQVDEKGVLNPYGENRIYYHLDGPTRIRSLESGNPVNTENNTGQSSRTAFFGLARCFLENTSVDGAISLVAGAILGEKQLMSSSRISIDVKPLAVRGNPRPYDVRVLFSTNGSKPKTPYAGPFEVEPGTVVRSEVFDGKRLLFSMSERFGPGEGLYWWSPGEVSATRALGGDQAEGAKFDGARISTSGIGFHGKGYLDFGNNKGAFVEWYQENDGGAGEFMLRIRYSGKPKNRDGRKMQLTVNGKKKVLFFPSTKGYGVDWKTLEVPIRLKPGANTIRLTTVEAGGMVIDEIDVR